MAQGRRVERVGALIRREVSDLLQREIKDQRLGHGLVSVTDVEVAGDLQHCRIFVSIFGNDEERRQAMEGLRSAAPFVRGQLGRRLQMRRAPEVVFQLDRGLERGSSVLSLLHELESERRRRESSEDAGGTATPA
jgi:ribosome-binding factor A